MGKKNPQVFLEECKYVVKENKMTKFINVLITDKMVAKQFKIWARKKFKGMPVIVGLFLIWENLF